MQIKPEMFETASPNMELALDQIEEWVAILAVEVGVGCAAKLLRRIAGEIEDLSPGPLQ